MNTSSPVANAETNTCATETNVAVAPKHAQRANEYSEAEIALLTKLWLEGQSASYIAKQLRGTTKRTKNSVIGKVHRLDLPPRAKDMRHASPPKVKRAPSKKVKPWKKPQIEYVGNKAFSPPPPKPEPEPELNLVPFTDAILSGTCTFSKIEWGKKCCGRKRHNGFSYCLTHVREAIK